MKKLFSFLIVLGFIFTTSMFNKNSSSELIAQTNHWTMPTPKWCPQALMYATECTASGMGCQIVKCKKANT